MSIEKQLERFLEEGILGATPGVRVRAYHKGELRMEAHAGQVYDHYDLASLTKIIFSVTSLMLWLSQEQRQKWDLQAGAKLLKSEVLSYLPWFPHKGVLVEELLFHFSGLSWWEPYYKEMDLTQPREQRWNHLRTLLSKTPRESVTKAIYSDLDFFTIGFLLETLYEKDLLAIWNQTRDFLGLEGLNFHKDNKPFYTHDLYAPTETCPWRKKTLQAEVHDENAWSMGGVAPHAGLFGSMEAVAKWALLIRNTYYSEGENSLGEKGEGLNPEILRSWTKRSTPPHVGDWGLGFMKPTPGAASCGSYFSDESFGHTGFTGTSFWMDPVKDLMVIVLSNRVHPTRENKNFLPLRPKIHDHVVELLGLGRSL